MYVCCYTYTGSAKAGIDFMMNSVNHTVNAGGHRCLEITILRGEEGVESDKSFFVVLSAVTPNDNIIVANDRTEVIIHDGIHFIMFLVNAVFSPFSLDNLVFFNETRNTVRENVGNFTICATALLDPTFRRNSRVVIASEYGTGIIKIIIAGYVHR